MMNERPTRYSLLIETDVPVVRAQLEKNHQHFYHFTLSSRIDSIKNLGLDPGYESTDSLYGGRDREPPKAMRFCTKSNLNLGFSVANQRNQIFNQNTSVWHPSQSVQVVLLRTKATSLLSRSFGLDHSYDIESRSAEELLCENKRTLLPNEFVEIINRHGSISCYETIPPGDLEICRELNNFPDYSKCIFYPLLG